MRARSQIMQGQPDAVGGRQRSDPRKPDGVLDRRARRPARRSPRCSTASLRSKAGAGQGSGIRCAGTSREAAASFSRTGGGSVFWLVMALLRCTSCRKPFAEAHGRSGGVRRSAANHRKGNRLIFFGARANSPAPLFGFLRQERRLFFFCLYAQPFFRKKGAGQ